MRLTAVDWAAVAFVLLCFCMGIAGLVDWWVILLFVLSKISFVKEVE